HSWRSNHAPAVLVNLPNALHQARILLSSRTWFTILPGVIAAGRNLQATAHQSYRVLVAAAPPRKGDCRATSSYTGVEKRPEHEGREVIWQIAARRSTYKKLDKRSALYKAKRKIEKAKAQVRAKVEHPFRVIKRQFG